MTAETELHKWMCHDGAAACSMAAVCERMSRLFKRIETGLVYNRAGMDGRATHCAVLSG